MDKSVRPQQIVILLSLAITLFIYIDTYWIPTKITLEKVEGVSEYRTGKRGQARVYTMTIRAKDYDVTRKLYNVLHVDQTAELEKSVLTGALQNVSLNRYSGRWTYETGFVRARLGFVLLPILTLGSIAVLLLFKKINVEGRRNISYALFIFCMLLLFAHLDFNLF